MNRYRKVVISAFFIGVLFLFVGCKGSKKIQGEWQAASHSVSGSTIKIEENKIVITENGQTESHTYTQNKIGFKNGISYYGVQINGKLYSIIFPKKKDTETALLILPDSEENMFAGTLLYAMSKNEKPNYAKFVEKYFSN